MSAAILGVGVFLALAVVLLGGSANANNGSGLQASETKIARVSAPAMIKPKAMKKPKQKAAPVASSTPPPVATSPSPSPAPAPKKKSSPKPRYEAPGVLR